jgi:Protein of unknown function (DUF2934)
MNATPEKTPTDIDVEEQKRQIAYQLWEEEGRPEGKAEEHWARACLVVMNFGEDGANAPAWLQRQQAEARSNAQLAAKDNAPDKFPEPLSQALENLRQRTKSAAAA